MNFSREQIETWMRQAMDLAEKGRGHVEPNPLVGCLILEKDQVIGAGWHEKFGDAHAEVNAIRNCKRSPIGGTAVVTLEPCCHHGKTPPCVQALMEAGISRVFVGRADPNPRVSGGGIQQLKNAGIQVDCGFLEAEISLQIAGFLKSIQQKKPWVIAKYAMTMDGRIATRSGDSQWISNESSRRRVHQLRGQVDGILVGSRTVIRDNPTLTARPTGPRQPTRMVMDSQALLPLDSHLLETAREIPVQVFSHQDADSQKIKAIRDAGAEVLQTELGPGERIDWILREMGQRQMSYLLVEGGGGLLGEFFQAGEIDEVQCYVAPRIVGNGISPANFAGPDNMSDSLDFQLHEVEQLDDNLLMRCVSPSSLRFGEKPGP
ncbi:MAG: bifunctional diaminohydroxyphosphoribosylaminopyrimidine deaminase/5-amino-6-(5-phosphoribosylamino)uracil reductase RibD [Planctomycetota bacterium]|nr:bifunctional diaminohydroxyphosphoribosylaminopyrimidine deaminase/5-amino-6-(5-phosphoribosylamino)uracil reductase RibD [Planctomycetota bacterium]